MLNHNNTKLRQKVDDHCFKQDKVTFAYTQTGGNIYIVYEINLRSYIQVADFCGNKKILYLLLLNWLKALILINIFFLDMEMDLIYTVVFRYLIEVVLAKTYLVQIWDHLCIWITKSDIFWFLVKVKQMVFTIRRQVHNKNII